MAWLACDRCSSVNEAALTHDLTSQVGPEKALVGATLIGIFGVIERIREYDEDTGQLVIRGMGELHLDVLVTRILKDFKVGAKVGNPQVSYRESITRKVEHAERYERVITSYSIHYTKLYELSFRHIIR